MPQGLRGELALRRLSRVLGDERMVLTRYARRAFLGGSRWGTRTPLLDTSAGRLNDMNGYEIFFFPTFTRILLKGWMGFAMMLLLRPLQLPPPPVLPDTTFLDRARPAMSPTLELPTYETYDGIYKELHITALKTMHVLCHEKKNKGTRSNHRRTYRTMALFLKTYDSYTFACMLAMDKMPHLKPPSRSFPSQTGQYPFQAFDPIHPSPF